MIRRNQVIEIKEMERIAEEKMYEAEEKYGVTSEKTKISKARWGAIIDIMRILDIDVTYS